MEIPYRDLVEQTPLAVTVHVEGTVVFANRAAEALLGLEAGQARGRRILDFVHPESTDVARRRARQVLGGFAQVGSFETTLLRPDDALVQVESVAEAVVVDGRPGVSVISCDVTERSRREARLAHLATHDPLTGLPNRTLLLDRLEVALARIGRDCVGVLVLFLDLDGFKEVNDSYGHRAGDSVLRVVAERLRHALRAGDTVARLAGDEFVVCAALEELSLAAALQERVTHALADAVLVDGARVRVGASVGAVVVEQPGDPLRVLSEADRLMYREKDRRLER